MPKCQNVNNQPDSQMFSLSFLSMDLVIGIVTRFKNITNKITLVMGMLAGLEVTQRPERVVTMPF